MISPYIPDEKKCTVRTSLAVLVVAVVVSWYLIYNFVTHVSHIFLD